MFILPLKILFPVLSYSRIAMYLDFYSTKASLILLHSKFLKRLYGKAIWEGYTIHEKNLLCLNFPKDSIITFPHANHPN